MGDKSPKSVQKSAAQKQAKSDQAKRKKSDAEAVRVAASNPKK